MGDSSAEGEVLSSLSLITGGASIFFVGKVLSSGFKFLLNFLLARALGVSQYGIYSYARTILGILMILARFGSGKSLLRLLPANLDESATMDRFAGLAYLTAFTGSTLVGVAVYYFTPLISSHTIDDALFRTSLRIFSVSLPFVVSIKLTSEIFRALEVLRLKVYLEDIAYQLVQLAIVGVGILIGFELIGFIAGIVIGMVLTALIAISMLLSKTSIRPRINSRYDYSQVKEYYNYSIPLMFKDIGSILYTKIDILMVGFFLLESSVGIYRIAVLLTTFLAFPLMGINQLFPPIASRLFSEGNFEELERVYSITARWALTFTLPFALVVSIYDVEVLTLFGSEFVAGGNVILFFALGRTISSAVGPSGYLLMMTDHQYYSMLNQWLLGVLNIALNYVLILEFGLIGAAVATVIVLILINFLRVGEIWYLERITPFSGAFLKPIMAGLLAGMVMIQFTKFLAGYVLLAVGSGVGVSAFFGTLALFGIEDRDKKLLEMALQIVS